MIHFLCLPRAGLRNNKATKVLIGDKKLLSLSLFVFFSSFLSPSLKTTLSEKGFLNKSKNYGIALLNDFCKQISTILVTLYGPKLSRQILAV